MYFGTFNKSLYFVRKPSQNATDFESGLIPIAKPLFVTST